MEGLNKMRTTTFKGLMPATVRERLGLTVEECAHWADVKPRTYRKWERQGYPVRRMMASMNMAMTKVFAVPDFKE